MTDPFWNCGQLLAGCQGSNVVTVWNPANSEVKYMEHSAASQTCQFTGNNKVLMRGGDDGTVQLFAGGEYLGCLPNNDSPASNVKMGALTCLRISKDSKRLFAGSRDSRVYVWDLKAQNLTSTFTEHQASITSLAVTHDDEYLATASSDGALMLHTPGSSKPLAVLVPAEREHAKRGLSFSPLEAGMLAAVSDDHSINLWSTMAGRQQHYRLPNKHTGKVTGCAFSTHHTTIMFSCGADRQVIMWDRRMGAHGSAVHAALLPYGASCLAPRDDGVNLAVGCADGAVYILDARKPEKHLLRLPAAHQGQPIVELSWQSAARQKKAAPSASRAAASTAAAAPSAAAAAAGTATSAQASAPAVSSAPAPAASSLAAASQQQAAVPAPSSRRPAAEIPAAAAAGGLGQRPGTMPHASASLSNWLGSSAGASSGAPGAPDAGNTGSQAAVQQGVQGLGSAVTAAPGPAKQASSEAQLGPGVALKEATNQFSGPARAGSGLQQGKGLLPGEQLQLQQPEITLPPSRLHSGALESPQGFGHGTPAESPHGASEAGGASFPVSPSRLAGRVGTSGAGAAGSYAGAGSRINLSEATFKSYMDDAFQAMREDMRNLHIELIKQFHVQQLEMVQIAEQARREQAAMAKELQTLRAQVDALTKRQQLGSWL